MRSWSGFMIIILLLPIFSLLVFAVSAESQKVQGFHELLDEKLEVKEVSLPQTSYIKAGNGKVISEIYHPVNRISLSSGDIPPFLKDVFITAEDQHFYDHAGFDVAAIGRALAVNIQSDDIEQGASTITQQLARNIFLNHEQTYNRKLSELLYAYELERKLSKEKILELYINAIYFHNGAYGIEAASQLYFKKSAKDLTNAQEAFLAAIPNNPSLYDPMKHFDHTKERQERLIDQLKEEQLISSKEAEKMKSERIQLQVKQRIDLYPDYVSYVEAELRELISVKEGYQDKLLKAGEQEKASLSAKLDKRIFQIMEQGIIIETALNPALQEKAANSLNKRLPYKDVEGAAAVIDNGTYEITALAGGKNYKKYDFNRAFQAYRQPGSAIKPLLVYAPYIEHTSAAIHDQVDAGPFCKNGYCPQNYGGARYGLTTLEKAFIYSYNTPAVRLLDEIGIENGFRDLDKLGFKQVSGKDRALSAAIGGFTYGMTPLELTSAYTVFANDGFYRPARSIHKITDLKGNLLYSWEDFQTQIWSEKTIEKVRDLMARTVQSGTARKALLPDGYAGGKTGTTNGYHDFWFVGLTGQYTAGVWVGKDRPGSLAAIESDSPQLLIWKDIMSD
ncbi:transglycosylase domain-containing protein [Cytobacillus oceanisediminis]|uniref:transglycosylase domain-containing protein n=1 Tax=Cytobacillus oceanisediminis TaxID=665099 RepID=UPI0023DC8B5F|nr:transglycosylase domain-containing protein [Cytobacillus oceanisediminis]MDF2037400.1 transglycosylase domain-containing protein [Cytobacillus oceanisediminis]